MKADIKKVNVFAAKWWNPLFWPFVVLAPVVGIVVGSVSGAFYGLLVGYERGLEVARNNLHKIMANLS